MGFCLFQEAAGEGLFFAVNTSHIEDVMPQRDNTLGQPVCLLKFSFAVQEFRPLVLGTRVDIQDVLLKAARIGVQKVEAQTFIGQKQLRLTPLVMNKVDRVGLVREVIPEKFTRYGIKASTASELYLADGTIKLIAERPGIFASRANAAGKVPMLNLN